MTHPDDRRHELPGSAECPAQDHSADEAGRPTSTDVGPSHPVALADGTWHRVHPLTPVLRSGALLIAMLGIGVSRLEDAVRSSLSDMADGSHSSGGVHHSGRLLVGAAILAAVLTVLLVTNWLAWRKNEFLIDDDSLHVRKGIIGKKQRKARLDRVQAIDVDQPLLPRLLGLAQLRFDVAGGHKSKLVIEYLRRADAEALRATMLDRVHVSRETRTGEATSHPRLGADAAGDGSAAARAADISRSGGRETGVGVDGSGLGGLTGEIGASAGEVGGPPSPADAQRAAWRTPPDAEAASLRPGAPVASRIVHGVVPGVIDDLSGTLTEALAPYRVAVKADSGGAILRVPPHRVLFAQFMTAGPLFGVLVFLATVVFVIVGAIEGDARDALSVSVTLLFMVFGFVHAAFRQFLRDANFSVALTGDGIVVTHGLTSTARRVIPVDRIQAVAIRQPLLWRGFGWWRVRMNLATGSAMGDGASSMLLPVGSIDDALMLMGLVLPDPGTSDDVSGRDLMVEAMAASRTTPATGAAAMFTGAGPRAGLLDPLTARREAWARTRTMTVIRRGRFVRRVACVPHARVQSMAVTQGPVQRALRLTTIELHSTAGPTKPRIAHQRQDVAERFLVEHAEITRRAREALDGR